MQIETDSIHSVLERKMRIKEFIYYPSSLILQRMHERIHFLTE